MESNAGTHNPPIESFDSIAPTWRKFMSRPHTKAAALSNHALTHGRRGFLRVAGGGVIAAALPAMAACSSTLPAESVSAWQVPTSGGADLRRWILAHAILAPHAHNRQSWLVELDQADTIVLRMDLTRMLPETDPFARQMTLSQGTFVELLDMAARQSGHRADISLFPEGMWDSKAADRRATARIVLHADASVRPDPLFAQVFNRRTNRERYEATLPAVTAIDALRASCAALPVKVGHVDQRDPQATAEHRRIAGKAWQIELHTPRTQLESVQLMRIGPGQIARHRDGISINDPFMRLLDTVGMVNREVAAAPDSMGVTNQIKDFDAKLVATPAFAWITTESNDRIAQINAGRAWLRMQLVATEHGLSMHPLSQALQEYPEQRDTYQAIHRQLGATASGQTVQMWARLGHGPVIGPSPRRGVDAHIVSG